ncbi:MAG: preprotein translocase subunit SecG [Actinobacteria bacterium]|nr:preprotein translocase subunit SecG [Actinomycetota bacterium]
MKFTLLLIEFISAILLTIAVLLHTAKGEGIGAIGGHARMFHSQKGLEDGLNRVTTVLAIIFVISAGVLGVF